MAVVVVVAAAVTAAVATAAADLLAHIWELLLQIGDWVAKIGAASQIALQAHE